MRVSVSEMDGGAGCQVVAQLPEAGKEPACVRRGEWDAMDQGSVGLQSTGLDHTDEALVLDSRQSTERFACAIHPRQPLVAVV